MNLNTTVNRRKLVRALFFVHRTRSVTASSVHVRQCVHFETANITACLLPVTCNDHITMVQ